jgi:oligopeptide transport system ATP-binding protein
VDPEFIVCDEPISALDVSIQAQVVNLLVKLQKELQLTYLFIAHDLSMVKHISDRVGVMYMGHIVELSDSNELYSHPEHPYTQALLSAIPIPNPQQERSKTVMPLEGEVGSPINCGPGCRFASRCKYATDQCRRETPAMKEIRPGHFVSCHLF